MAACSYLQSTLRLPSELSSDDTVQLLPRGMVLGL
jgi:hypothetical protein